MFDASTLSREAKKICKHEGMTPRFWEPLNGSRPAAGYQPGDEEYPVLRVWNSKREITITNADLAYVATYL